MSEPSVLTYARYFGLTAGSEDVDPLSCLRNLPRYQQNRISTIRNDAGCQRLLRTFERVAEEQMSLPSEPPDLVHSDSMNYLRSCWYLVKDFPNREEMYRQLRCAAWTSDPRRLKVEEPLLMDEEDVEEDVCEIHRAGDPGVRLDYFHSKFDGTALKEIEQSLSAMPPLLEATSDAEHAFGEGIQHGVLCVTADALDYLKVISTSSLDTDAIYRLAKENLPLRRGLSLLAHRPLADDDLYFSSNDEGTIYETMPAVAGNLGSSASVFKDEADLLAHLDSSTDQQTYDKETLFCDGTRLDDLFEQFTHHDTPGVFDSGNAFHFVPPDDSEGNSAKQLEQMITPFEERVAVKVTSSESSNQASDHRPPADICLPLPQLPLVKPSLPTIEVATVIARVISSIRDMPFDNALFRSSTNLRLLPFLITSMEDLMPCLEPLNTAILDKLHQAPDKVIDAENLLWREPGLRILDRQDDEDEELVAEEYDIDESMKTPFTEAEVVNGPSTKAQNFHGEAESIINANKVECSPPANPRQNEPFQIHPNAFKGTPCVKDAFQDTVTSATSQTRKRNLSEENGENDSFMQNSLSSFLDLRGKRFKLPPGVRNREGRDMKDDPIQTTQEGRVDNVVDARDLQDPKEATEQKICQEINTPVVATLDCPRTIIVCHSVLRDNPLLGRFLERTDATTRLT